MIINEHGVYYAARIIYLLQQGRVQAVSKRFVPATHRERIQPGVAVSQTVTWTEKFPNQMISDIMTNYEDGKILDNGDQEFQVYESTWTLHLKEKK